MNNILSIKLKNLDDYLCNKSFNLLYNNKLINKYSYRTTCGKRIERGEFMVFCQDCCVYLFIYLIV